MSDDGMDAAAKVWRVERRALASLAIAIGASIAPAWANDSAASGGGAILRSGGGDDLDRALQRFGNLPGTKSYLVHVGEGGGRGQLAHHPRRLLFTASAYKTFVLGQHLRDVETGLLSEDEQLAVDDSVRMISSPVFFTLSGTTQARSVLDGMIAYSDNTATDLATHKVGADRVRSLISQLGLSSIRMPDSTPRFFSYLLGAPAGIDFTWEQLLTAIQNPPGPLRPPLNEVVTLAGCARDFVSWYEQTLLGNVFDKPETSREFKRILSESVQIPLAVPADTAAYAKGGELPALLGFPLNAKSFAGQMIIGSDENKIPVTFCFIVNWDGPSEDFPAVEAEFFASIQEVLSVIKQSCG